MDDLNEMPPEGEVGPWMPLHGYTPRRDNRQTSHRYYKLISGLTSEAVYPQFAIRLGTYLVQIRVAVTNENFEWPVTAIYEHVPGEERLRGLLQRLQNDLGMVPDKNGVREIFVKVRLRWFNSGWANVQSRQIMMPPADARRICDHAIDMIATDGTTAYFMHNWDGWTQMWTMPWTYVEDNFVEAWYAGPAGTACGQDYDAEPVLCDTDPLIRDYKAGIELQPASDTTRVVMRRSHSLTEHSEMMHFYAVTHNRPSVEIVGWLWARVTSGTLRIEELFVHSEFRGRGVASALAGSAAFQAYTLNRNFKVQFIERECDQAVTNVAVKPPHRPNWLTNLPWLAGPDGTRRASVSTLELLPRILHGPALAAARARGCILVSDFGIHSSGLPPETYSVGIKI